jgi:hypothetical protein
MNIFMLFFHDLETVDTEFFSDVNVFLSTL